MNRIVALAAVAALLATPAFAAPPSPPPAPVYNWTGFYVGGNIGASFGRAKTDYNVAPVALFAGLQPPTLVTTFPGFAGSAITEPAGFIGGGQIGYNSQFSPIWVAGLEADIQGSGERDGIPPFTNSANSPPAVPGGTATTVTNYEAKIDWFGTVRGRIGYLFGDGTVLAYVTGGLAYGRVGVDGTSTVSVPGDFVFSKDTFSAVHTIGHSQVNTGWTIGTGTEGKLLNFPGWTLKAEALYMDLGDLDDTDKCNHCVITGGQVFTHTHFTDTILRVGLNYQFH